MTPDAEPARQSAEGARPRLIVAVCTYRRNEQLRRLLAQLVNAADEARDVCAVGAVVVDDNADGAAAAVAVEFAERLELGLHYRVSGERNISKARNIGLDAAMEHGDWVAMTDDDCVPDSLWLVELIASQRRTGAGAVSGPLVRRVPSGSPRWLVDQPVLEQGISLYARDDDIGFASTHNSMLSVAWMRTHPDVRFDTRLGRVGGEDMLFYKTAHRRGLQIAFCRDAVVYEDQPAERLTFGFLLWQALWLGNSSFVTSLDGGEATRWRLAAHGVVKLGQAAMHPLRQLARRSRPQLRYSALRFAGGAGILVGALGVRIRHH